MMLAIHACMAHAALFPVKMYQRVEKKIYKNPSHHGSLQLQMPFE